MIAIFKFRVNDLHPSKGKQIEFNVAKVEEFFQFQKDEEHITFRYKSLTSNDPLNGTKIKVYLKLSPSRGDYKIYQNSDGSDSVKDFFIEKLHLDIDKNADDYFALRKASDSLYDLYYIPQGEPFAKFYEVCVNNSEYIIEDRKDSSSISSNLLLFQFDDPTEFVWECIKHFNKNNELNILFKSDYRSAGGSLGNYIRINGCYVAQQGEIENLDCIFTETDGAINNGFDARNVDAFADAVNDIYRNKYKVVIEGDSDDAIYKLIQLQPQNIEVAVEYTPYLTALRTKPFMLLAGISGTGKSRIAREIAKACWPVGSEQREKQVPDNFCMVQVKPNWHDSTELIGYVSRIGGEKYVTGDLLPFITKAWENPSIPYILCLDEMNLAPVEQYFAEYLSVIESRRVDSKGKITTDPIIKKDKSDWFRVLTAELTNNDNLRAKFLEEGISIPQNLFVVGTVNMDETTFSFSRKVLDRAMTIEMNEVDLRSSLSEKPEGDLGYISNILLSNAAKGTDVYISNQALCDSVVEYLEKVNAILDGSPFKIAYRTRNEFMLYTVNRAVIETESPLWKSLDEMTSMKILSRIEGDEERCKVVLNKLNDLLKEQFAEHLEESISIKKVNEMIKKMSVGYTSYWT